MSESSPLVSTEWLAEHLDDPRVRVVELQYELDVDDYTHEGHIPGAVSWYWKDLLWVDGRREFPTPAQAVEWLADHGVSLDDTLVLYSGRTQYATYAYWVLSQLCGLDNVRVLDGGRQGWVTDGWALEREPVSWPPVTATNPPQPARDDGSRVGRDELLDRLDGQLRILDLRYPPEYAGERVKPGTGPDHGAEVYGHIPGARSLPFRCLVDDEDDRVRPREELEAELAAAGATSEDEIVVYCRLGHRASLGWFVVSKLLGWPNVRVYDGSWTEWGSMVGAPVER